MLWYRRLLAAKSVMPSSRQDAAAVRAVLRVSIESRTTARAIIAMPPKSMAHFTRWLPSNNLSHILLPLFFRRSSSRSAHSWFVASRLSPIISSGIPPGPGNQPVSADARIHRPPTMSTPMRFKRLRLCTYIVALYRICLTLWPTADPHALN